jgi:hypothetical protein
MSSRQSATAKEMDMTQKLRRNAAIAGALVVVLGVAAGLGIAEGAGSNRGVPTVIPHAVIRRIAANTTVLDRRFPILGRARASSAGGTALPPVFAEELAQNVAKPVPAGGLDEPDPSLAVYVGSVNTAVRGTLNVWALPGANDLCIAKIPSSDKGGSVECQSDQSADEGGLFGVDYGPGGQSTVVGLLPGSPSSVAIHQSDGTSTTTAATNGLWVVNDDPQAVTATASGVGAISIQPPSGGSR